MDCREVRGSVHSQDSSQIFTGFLGSFASSARIFAEAGRRRNKLVPVELGLWSQDQSTAKFVGKFLRCCF